MVGAHCRRAHVWSAARVDGGTDVWRRGRIDAITGPDGVTQKASSFSRRDAVIDLTTHSAVLSTNATDTALRVEALVRHPLRDQRVVPVLAPGPRTSSEVLRVRDATGRVVRTVDQSERRYTTVDLLTAETELLHRAATRQGAGVDVVVGRAGTGKSTALGAYRAALDAAGIPVVGVAPSATAAHQLAMSAGITDTATVDRLLVELDLRCRTLPRGVVVILDEATMCPTRKRLALQHAVDAVDGKIVDVGGGHYALAQRLGASVLGQNHRFRDPVYRDAAELLRDRRTTVAVRNGMTGRVSRPADVASRSNLTQRTAHQADRRR